MTKQFQPRTLLRPTFCIGAPLFGLRSARLMAILLRDAVTKLPDFEETNSIQWNLRYGDKHLQDQMSSTEVWSCQELTAPPPAWDRELVKNLQWANLNRVLEPLKDRRTCVVSASWNVSHLFPLMEPKEAMNTWVAEYDLTNFFNATLCLGRVDAPDAILGIPYWADRFTTWHEGGRQRSLLQSVVVAVR